MPSISNYLEEEINLFRGAIEGITIRSHPGNDRRERTPKGQDVPAGLASNFMHDFAIEGTVIAAKPPSGKFIDI